MPYIEGVESFVIFYDMRVFDNMILLNYRISNQRHFHVFFGDVFLFNVQYLNV